MSPPLRWTVGPSPIQWVLGMFCTILLLGSILIAIAPNLPAWAVMADPETQARALAGQRRGALLGAGFGLVTGWLLLTWRRLEIDLDAREVRSGTLRLGWTRWRRRLPFQDLHQIDTVAHDEIDYTHFTVILTPRQGAPLHIGPFLDRTASEALVTRLRDACGRF